MFRAEVSLLRTRPRVVAAECRFREKDPAPPDHAPDPAPAYASARPTDAANASTIPVHCTAVSRSRSTIPASTTVPIG